LSRRQMSHATPHTFAQRLSLFAADIKLSHSIFAMPWAILATVMAAQVTPGGLRAGQVALIVICMVLARTVAMGMNRLLDANLDRANPRTARRAIPSGQLSAAFVTGVVVLCSVGFVAACAGFGLLYGNWIPVFASLPVLAFVGAYPFLKRFTRLCHYYLGAALALAPVCAWVAIAGSLAVEPFLMAAAVMFWTAGFDIIYACQDYESDVATGVFSVPARVGIARALWIARLTHLLCIGSLIALVMHSPQLGLLFAKGIGLAVALMIVEHAIVKPNDLSRVNLAFFTFNGIISVVLGVLGVIDVLQ
jgi:4-hydroxybenzoate polyprenyltransferase